jgi:hypothetical protein
MEPASNAAERFIVPLDPPRAFLRACDDLERLVKLDPKVRAATELLDERFARFTGESREVVATVLWAYSRNRVKVDGLEGFRDWLDDGQSMLRTVELALGSVFSMPVLNELLQHGTETLATDSPSGTELRQARDEVRQVLSTDSVLVIAFLTGYGAFSLYHDLTHEPSHPPSPPPPPPHYKKAVHPEHPH